MKDEYYHEDSEYDDIQKNIKNNLRESIFRNSYDLDAALNIESLKSLVLKKSF